MSPEPCRASKPSISPNSADEAAALFRRCLSQRAPQPAWNELTRRYESRLRSTLRSAFGPRRTEADVEDCLQDLYLRLLSLGPEAFRGSSEGELERYLVCMARNLARDRRRRTRCERRCFENARVYGSGDATSLQPVQERRVIARQLLGGYLRHCRTMIESAAQQRTPAGLRFQAVRLALFEGWGSREIARRLDGRLSAPQIDSLVHRLRRRLAREGILMGRRRRAGDPRGAGGVDAFIHR